MRMKEESERASLKLNIKTKTKTKKQLRSWHLPPLFNANILGKGGSSDRFPFLGL